MYKNEELIYSNTVDVSKESGVPNNKVYTRVVKRIKVKPKNLFRRTEKIIVYFDVECEGADLYNELSQVQDKVHRIEKNEIWKAQNFALTYKINEPYTHREISVFKNGVKC